MNAPNAATRTEPAIPPCPVARRDGSQWPRHRHRARSQTPTTPSAARHSSYFERAEGEVRTGNPHELSGLWPRAEASTSRRERPATNEQRDHTEQDDQVCDHVRGTARHDGEQPQQDASHDHGDGPVLPGTCPIDGGWRVLLLVIAHERNVSQCGRSMWTLDKFPAEVAGTLGSAKPLDTRFFERSDAHDTCDRPTYTAFFLANVWPGRPGADRASVATKDTGGRRECPAVRRDCRSPHP